MSTPASIVVHVRPEDVNHFRKCDIKKINLRTAQTLIETYKKLYGVEKGVEMAKSLLESGCKKIPNSTSMLNTIKKVKIPEYIEIYHHWDGFPDSLGEELKKNYNSYELALNLCLAGNFSTIMDGSVPYCGIGRKWCNEGPSKYSKLPSCWLNYQYLFENGKWYCRRSKYGKFKEI